MYLKGRTVTGNQTKITQNIGLFKFTISSTAFPFLSLIYFYIFRALQDFIVSGGLFWSKQNLILLPITLFVHMNVSFCEWRHPTLSLSALFQIIYKLFFKWTICLAVVVNFIATSNAFLYVDSYMRCIYIFFLI